jgi:hypothetical protein
MSKDKFNQKIFDLHGQKVDIDYKSNTGRRIITIKWDSDPTKSYILVGKEKIHYNQIYSIT